MAKRKSKDRRPKRKAKAARRSKSRLVRARRKPTPKRRPAPKRAARKVKKARKPQRPRRKPTKPLKRKSRLPEVPALNRSRRVLPDVERFNLDKSARAGAGQDRMLSAARTGHDELRHELAQHTESSPSMTAGDVDAKWQDAYAVGDEAPGGDNPTPDQDRVDDIGRALGIQYQDDQELQGGEELTDRDRHRWELDPASSEDWPHDRDKE